MKEKKSKNLVTFVISSKRVLFQRNVQISRKINEFRKSSSYINVCEKRVPASFENPATTKILYYPTGYFLAVYKVQEPRGNRFLHLYH